MGRTTSAFIFLLAAASSLTSATPLTSRENDNSTLADWQVQSVDTHSPSGRPGNYPWLTVTATIVDPNTYNLGTPEGGSEDVIIPANNTGLDCQAKWISPDSAYGKRWACDNNNDEPIGYWYMEVLEVPGGTETENFDLRFTRVIEGLWLGRELQQTYQGQANFAVGANMRGSCGGSGVCNWFLREEDTPYPIKQERIPDEQPAEE